MQESTYTARCSELQARMREAGVDAALFTDADSIAWLAGYWGYLGIEWGRPTLLFVPQAGDCTLITPLMESEMARAMTWIADLRPWEDGIGDEWRAPLRALLGGRGGLALAVERLQIPARISLALAEAFAELRYRDAGALLGPMRQIKSAAEIAVMKQAGQVAIAMLDGARAVIAEGVPEYELALAVIDAGTRKAASFLGDEGIDQYHAPTVHNLQVLQSGSHTCMVHRRANSRRLRRGDPVYLCFCGMVDFKGYKLGFDRELFVGEASDEQRRVYQTALRAQLAALENIRPGAIAEEIHYAADAVYREAGFAPGYRTGRSVGCSNLEQPELKVGDRSVLQAGMTFAVDGGITIAGRFGGRVGDSIVVTEDGFEYLTPYPKELAII